MQDFEGQRSALRTPPINFVEGVVVQGDEDLSPIYAKVRLPGYHTKVDDADLPVYRLLLPVFGTGHNVTNGSQIFAKLAPGTRVEVLLRDETGYVGSIFGVYPNESNAARPDGLVHGWRDSIGNAVEFYADGRTVFQDKAGVKVETDGAGKITINATAFELNTQTTTINTVNYVLNSETMVCDDTSAPEAPELTPREVEPPPETSDLKDKW
jgi:hypothetical protein